MERNRRSWVVTAEPCRRHVNYPARSKSIPDAVYDAASQQFSEAELAQLTLAIVTINGRNRFNVAFHTPAGNYKSSVKQSAA